MIELSNVLDTLTPKHLHLLPVIFFQFYLEERWGMDKCKLGVISQERLKIEIKLLLSANRKSYMPHQLIQQWMTLSDLECVKSTSSASCAVSAVAELLVNLV